MSHNALAVLPSFAQNMMPALPAEMRDILLANFAPAMDTFGGGFNRVSLKGSRIRLIAGGQEVRQELDALDFVIVGISPDQYCVWYKNKYSGEEGIEPDAVWAMNEEPPANVPPSALVKDADGRNQYSVRRRIIIAPVSVPTNGGAPFVDLENLFAFDMGGMSTFGDDINIGNFAFGKAYSFSNYIGLLKQHGMIPAACITKMIFDQSQSVPVVRFCPIVGADQKIQMLDMGTLGRVVEVIQDSKVAEMLDWRRGAPAAAPAQPAQQPQQAVQQPQQAVQQPAQQPAQQVVQQPQQAVQQPAQQVVQQAAPAGNTVQDALAQQMTSAVQSVQQPQPEPQQPVQQAAPAQAAPAQAAPAQAAPAQAAPAQDVVGDDALKDALAGLMSDAAFA
ncbi:TPA: hypothetical protein MCX08_001164 [Klebsiella pneumoniae]|nr:hypothetical protein [Klebsiella pneumoniae]